MTMPGSGLYRGSHIAVFSGGFVDPLNFQPGDANIEDIAHALGNLCRFNGHTSSFYSVAEHCIHAAERMAKLGGTPMHCLGALLHDCEEAYLGDMSRPLKMTTFGDMARGVGMSIRRAVFLGLEIPVSHIYNKQVKEIDNDLLAIEAKHFFSTWEEWDLTRPDWTCSIYSWPPGRASKNFLDLYHHLATKS